MKQTHTLAPQQSIKFSAGQIGKYLIVRDASHTVSLRGDQLRPMEIERGDTVDVREFDVLEIINHHSEVTIIEFQLADITVVTKAHKVNVENAIVVDEILNPITVSEVQRPVTVEEISNPVIVSQIQQPLIVEQIKQSVSVSKIYDTVNTRIENFGDIPFPDVQKVEIQPGNYSLNAVGDYAFDDTGTVQIAKANREQIFIQASMGNTGNLLINDFVTIRPGGHMLAPATNAEFIIKGLKGDEFNVGEIVSL